jgi:hypothetical protein
MRKLARLILYPCFLVFLALSGCTAIHQQIVAAARQAGEKVVTTPEKVVQESKCAKREQTVVHFESLEVLPETVKPGARVNYRLIYVMCPLKKFSETVKARVTRNMLFNGEQVAHNVKEIFELKAGRWAVDSFFTLPPESPLGVYALEVVLKLLVDIPRKWFGASS